eukprot:TRINITY_DN1737_c0_g1_i2.p1 TRINITY_DN1737_c0_g1~~TRINITY_DN1737_c0_g1_i2.p1  ORF type:complete len:724 (+),score=105.21 TRINITY_DN1737_c0_g1_i2:121-2292(+)
MCIRDSINAEYGEKAVCSWLRLPITVSPEQAEQEEPALTRDLTTSMGQCCGKGDGSVSGATIAASAHPPQNAFCWNPAKQVPLERHVHSCMIRRNEVMQLTNRRRSLTDDLVAKYEVKGVGSLKDDSGSSGRILQQLVAACRRNRLFHYHSSAEIAEVLKSCVAVRLPAAQRFFEADKFDSHFAIVMEGQLTVSHKGAKVAEVNSLQTIGELELLFDCPRLYDVRPQTVTLMYILSGAVCGEVVQFVRKKLLSILLSEVILTNRLEHKHAQAAQSAGLFFWADDGQVILQPRQTAFVVALLLEGQVTRDTGETQEFISAGQHFGVPHDPRWFTGSSLAIPERKDTYTVSSAGGAVLLLLPWSLFVAMHKDWRALLSTDTITPETFDQVEVLNSLTESGLVRVCRECTMITLQPGGKLPAEAASGIVTVLQGTLVHQDDAGETVEYSDGSLACGAGLLRSFDGSDSVSPTPHTGEYTAGNDSETTVAVLLQSDLIKLKLRPPPQSVVPLPSSPTGEGKFSNSNLSTGDFGVLGMLGTGANGKVQLVRYTPQVGQDCEQLIIDKLYALKSYNKLALKVSHTARREVVPAVVQNEKEMMMLCNSPLVVKIEASFLDTTDFHMLLEFVRAGDLFSLLDRHDHLPAKSASFYMVCIALGMDHLHKKCSVFMLCPHAAQVDCVPRHEARERHDRRQRICQNRRFRTRQKAEALHGEDLYSVRHSRVHGS